MSLLTENQFRRKTSSNN